MRHAIRRSDKTAIRGWIGEQTRMSIREIARTLYQLQKRMEELEQAWKAENSESRRESLEAELRKVRAEYRRARSILEGEKGPTSGPSR